MKPSFELSVRATTHRLLAWRKATAFKAVLLAALCGAGNVKESRACVVKIMNPGLYTQASADVRKWGAPQHLAIPSGELHLDDGRGFRLFAELRPVSHDVPGRNDHTSDPYVPVLIPDIHMDRYARTGHCCATEVTASGYRDRHARENNWRVYGPGINLTDRSEHPVSGHNIGNEDRSGTTIGSVAIDDSRGGDTKHVGIFGSDATYERHAATGILEVVNAPARLAGGLPGRNNLGINTPKSHNANARCKCRPESLNRTNRSYEPIERPRVSDIVTVVIAVALTTVVLYMLPSILPIRDDNEHHDGRAGK